jgi:chromate transporter
LKAWLDLLWTFIKIGATSFGGGYAMIPVIERELIRRKGWTNMDEVMDYYTIAQITPGIIAVNLSTFIGYKRKGPLGGLLSTVGFLIPGVTFMAAVSIFMKQFAEYPAVQCAFAGIRIAVGALILDTILKLVKGVFRDKKAVVIFILGFVLPAVFSVSPVFIVAGAGAAGFFLYRPQKGLPAQGAEKEPPEASGGLP